MKMNKVQSSCIVAIGHDGKEEMRVKYKGLSFYSFKGVSVKDFKTLQSAKSLGSCLHKMGVKGTKMATSKCSICMKVSIQIDEANTECQTCGHLEKV